MFIGDVSRKGFRDTGRGGASNGELLPEGKLGEAALLRKGLFEERFKVSPGERDSKTGYLVSFRVHACR